MLKGTTGEAEVLHLRQTIQARMRSRILEAIQVVLEEELGEALGPEPGASGGAAAHVLRLPQGPVAGAADDEHAAEPQPRVPAADQDAGVVLHRGGGCHAALRAGRLRPDPSAEDRRAPSRVRAPRTHRGGCGMSAPRVDVHIARADETLESPRLSGQVRPRSLLSAHSRKPISRSHSSLRPNSGSVVIG